MSKLIVEMEMPICCADCPCCICLNGMKPAYCKAVMVDDDNIVDGLMWRETDPNNRPSWCPIVGELPEQHGDLVDADTVLWGEEVPDSEGIVVPVTIGDVIEGYDVQIVIAAERKDDEQIH